MQSKMHTFMMLKRMITIRKTCVPTKSHSPCPNNQKPFCERLGYDSYNCPLNHPNPDPNINPLIPADSGSTDQPTPGPKINITQQ